MRMICVSKTPLVGTGIVTAKCLCQMGQRNRIEKSELDSI